jgi:hypothetical protein
MPVGDLQHSGDRGTDHDPRQPATRSPAEFHANAAIPDEEGY